MPATGLRISNVCRLQVADIHSARGVIRVRQGKGGKDRETVPPARLLAQWICGSARLPAHPAPAMLQPAPGPWGLELHARLSRLPRGRARPVHGPRPRRQPALCRVQLRAPPVDRWRARDCGGVARFRGRHGPRHHVCGHARSRGGG
ncbi:MAG: hypothetical protein EXR79_13480 [Myxococcales bacterium]|nr:hypothetical protein [Myxococcales bacterium]